MKHILVVGFGLAGALTSIELAKVGHRVTLIEKNATPGGISAFAGGGIRASTDAKRTLDYMKITMGGRTPDDVLRVCAEGMTRIPERVRQLAKINDSEVVVRGYDSEVKPSHQYGFDGFDSLVSIRINHTPDVDLRAKFPHVRCSSRRDGIRLFNIVYDHVIAMMNIEVKYNTGLLRLIKRDGAVVGASTSRGDIMCDAVVIACGGFENSVEMRKDFFQGLGQLTYGFDGNTGDGIRACSEVGADLWHMWHYHGGYGFRHPDGFGCEMRGVDVWSPQERDPTSKRPLHHILVDKNGRRFMNEHPPNVTDHGWRPMELWCPEERRYPRIPAYFISDEQGRSTGAWGSVRTHRQDAMNKYPAWSEDNLAEIGMGMITKCDTLDEVSGFIGCRHDVLKQTLQFYNNEVCVNGDAQFRRPRAECRKIQQPPYYVAEIYPLIGNTQGGPRKDKNFQVVNAFNEPIPGLYVNGECGSIWGHVYLGAGNFAECFVGSEAITNHIGSTPHTV
jgi:succinate dehydrogenase/fumarate reductase flavoprotein subunit